jgi:RNA polymerase sigma-70 factor (ECF subfamily)
MDNHTLIADYYKQHRDEIVGFIAVRIADTEEAEDMVHDLFLRLLNGRQPIMPQTLPSLAYVMARHAVTDYFRRRRVHEEYEHYLKNTDFSEETTSVISARQLMERMEYSLARLPESCARIYRLHIYDGMKVGEIARELSLPYKQVENRLGQARRTVRQQLRAVV